MDEALAERLKALAHPARLAILRTLANRGRCVCGEVVEVMPLAQATVSQHLRVLKDAGLIQGRIDGRNSCYCLDGTILAVRATLDRLLARTIDRGGDARIRGGGCMNTHDEIRTLVRERYGAIAQEAASCCVPGSCGCGPEMAPDGLNVIGDAYQGVAGRLEDADLNLGCGVPTGHAALRPGETVLDLGSGAGNDAFIARREVGPGGRVIGVDMTPEMIARARGNAAKLGFANVEFRLGEIERLPVEASTVDVVISNCVINLVPDKAQAFAEMFRVLRPGGRFCVSDIVATGVLPPGVRRGRRPLCRLHRGCDPGA